MPTAQVTRATQVSSFKDSKDNLTLPPFIKGQVLMYASKMVVKGVLLEYKWFKKKSDLAKSSGPKLSPRTLTLRFC